MNEVDLKQFFCKERCFWCDGPMFDKETLDAHPELERFRKYTKTRDHLVPRKSGGQGYTVPCCSRCNHLKASQDPMKFRDKHRPHIPIEKVIAALLEAKLAHAAISGKVWQKKRVTRRRRVIR